MANLSVRRLDDKVYQSLCMQAAAHGVSMEEEARQILSQAVAAPARISEVFRGHFGAKMGVDLNIRYKSHEFIGFSE